MDHGPSIERVDLRQHGLEPGERVLHRIEVRTEGRQVATARADGFDRGHDRRCLVVSQIVDDDDVAVAQLRREHLIDIGSERDPVDRPLPIIIDATMPVFRKSTTKVVVFQCSSGIPTRGVSPVGSRTRFPGLFGRGSVRRALEPRDRRLLRLILDADEPPRIEVDLSVEPRLLPLQDIGSVLLGGVGGLSSARFDTVRRTARTTRPRPSRLLGEAGSRFVEGDVRFRHDPFQDRIGMGFERSRTPISSERLGSGIASKSFPHSAPNGAGGADAQPFDRLTA